MTVEHRSEHLDMPGLLFREQIAGAPEVEVALADRKAGTRLAELLQYRQTFLGLLRGGFRQQMGKGARAAASHPSPELMQLRKSELFGPAHHDGVRARNIETAFHDVGRQQHVRLAIDETHHAVVDLVY